MRSSPPARAVAKARVMLSGVAPVPWRAKALEAALAGRRLDAKTIRRTADAAVDAVAPMADNGYKVALAKGVVEEALTALLVA